MAINRRVFIKNSGIAMLGLSTLPSFLQRAVAATAMPNKKKLVVLFQRGAADGLNIVVPFGEPNYYRIRPSIAIPAPTQGGNLAAIDLDDNGLEQRLKLGVIQIFERPREIVWEGDPRGRLRIGR